MPTTWGPFQAYCYRSILDGIEHIAMVKVTNYFCFKGQSFIKTFAITGGNI